MTTARYDAIADFYIHFIEQGLADPDSLFNQILKEIFKILGDVDGQRICDLACGEGYLARLLASRGALVTGVDISSTLLEHAQGQSRGLDIDYIQDDAQRLGKLNEASFDALICNMALMDIPDLSATYSAVRRVLKPGGDFILSILHPCFETPYTAPNGIVETDADGNFVACRVMRYSEEKYWQSGGEGMRGKVGAYHRKLSTYINLLLANGFQLNCLAEPILPPGEYATLGAQMSSKIPRVLIIEALRKDTVSWP